VANLAHNHRDPKRDPTNSTDLRRRLDTDLRRALSLFRERVHTSIVKVDVLGYETGFANQQHLSKSLIGILRRQANTTFGPARKRLAGILQAAYVRGRTQAQKEIGVSNAVLPSPEAQAIIANAESELDKMLSETIDRIIQRLGSADGSDTRFNLYRKVILPNLMRPLSSRLHSLTETNITRVYNAGKLDYYEASNVQSVGVRSESLGKAAAKLLRTTISRDSRFIDADEDELDYYQVETAGDDRVCEICLSYESALYTLEEARELLPAHPNCRCAVIPA